ncbi:MAG: NUDIX domain-containing protein [Anaerolineales bacterium]|nr:NUDIX domain-containing protein [Anaerolineales bacterium]
MSTKQSINFCMICGHRMHTREAFGRARPVCPQCGHIHFQEPKVAAAVLVQRDGEVLLVRRVNVPEKGKWTIPAGFVDAGEDPASAAVRECFEETGLQVSITELLDVISGREHSRGADIIILYRAEIEGGSLAASDDADEVGFFAPDAMPPIAFEATRRALGYFLQDH